MDLHFLGSFVLPEPAMNPGGRRREKTVGVILTDLVVEFVAREFAASVRDAR